MVKKNKRMKCFYNQLTMVVHFGGKTINAKIFKNGTIQCTGVKDKESGQAACRYIASLVHPDAVMNAFRIVLINSDFSVGWRIRRLRLFEIMTKNGMFCTYEPCIYPGVNTKYFWNTTHMNRPQEDRGVCRCTNVCYGKGTGHGDGQCKRVTVASFQSGTTIITGANSLKQLDDVYQYITMIYNTHRKRLEKKEEPPPKASPSNTTEEIEYVLKKEKNDTDDTTASPPTQNGRV